MNAREMTLEWGAKAKTIHNGADMILYHYTEFNNGLDDILNSHIKVSTLDSVNDPYEWVPCVQIPDGTVLPVDHVRNWWYERYKDQYGFVCLSKSCTNPVMWTHYASKHQGMVLEFECAPSASDIRPVKYCTRRAKFENLEKKNKPQLKEVFLKFIQQKYLRWRYEDEWRAYVSIPEQCVARKGEKGLLYFLPLEECLRLKTVIVGYAARNRIGEVRNALYYGDYSDTVRIKKAELSEHGYRMRIVSP